MGVPSDSAEANVPSNSLSAASWPADGKPSATYDDGSHRSHSHSHAVTPKPSTSLTGSHAPESSSASSFAPMAKLQLTTTSELEAPLTLSAKTLRGQLNLVQKVFVKHDMSNWIAHSCLIATDLDHARRQLQDDLYATDDASLIGADLERTLDGRGFSATRIDAFVGKVLKVLDGIASADEAEAGGPAGALSEDPAATAALETELQDALSPYPAQTRDAMKAAAIVLEYLHQGKDEQEKKRLQVERRVGVLQGMVKIGEQVSKVVSFLLADSQ